MRMLTNYSQHHIRHPVYRRAAEASAATAECKLPGNLVEAVKRGWEIIHFRPEVVPRSPDESNRGYE